MPCAQRKEKFLIQVCSELTVEGWSNATPLQRGTSDSNHQVLNREKKIPQLQTGRYTQASFLMSENAQWSQSF